MERPLHPETMKMGFGCILFGAMLGNAVEISQVLRARG